jgi:L-arabinose isomerase
MSNINHENKANVGLLGFGLETYWNQFRDLRKTLERYQSVIFEHISQSNANILDYGMVDNPEKAHSVSLALRRDDVQLLLVFIATYSLSSTMLPIAQSLKVPVILLNLQPSEAIDYEYVNGLGDRGEMTGQWLSYCQACAIPEYANVLKSAGVPFRIVTGHLNDDSAWSELQEWISAASAVAGMRNNRLGLLGHYYNGMLDVYTDLRQQTETFGTQIEIIEMSELKGIRDGVGDNEISDKIKEFRNAYEVSPDCEESELRRAAKTSSALDALVRKHSLGSLAYYYEGVLDQDYEDIVTSLIAGNTLLTGKGIPVAGEYEVKNAQAMKILSLLGAGGSFSEFYAMDFKDDVVLLGHDGPAHFNMAEGKVKLVPVPVYHGKPGKGLSIQMTVRHGPVTLLSVCEGRDGVFLLAAEGTSVPGPTLQIGNTNSRYRFSCSAKEFIERWSMNGPSHHCAIGIGHVASELEKTAFLFGIQFIRIV